MAIEFRCNQCGRLLRTGDDTAGRMAQCPECGSQTPIPFPSPEEPATPQEAEYVPPADSGSPFGSSSSDTPFGSASSDSQAGENPDQSPQQAWRPVQQITLEHLAYVKSRVEGPAIGLIVTAILGIVAQILVVAVNVADVGNIGNAPNINGQQMPNFLMPQLGIGFAIGSAILELILAILVLVGGMKMRRLEGYNLSIAAAIIALFPCFSPCCLVGLPIGIWALVVLSDPNVKSAFK